MATQQKATVPTKAPITYRLRRALVQWLGGSFTPATSAEFLQYWNSTSTAGGQTVSESNVMSLSAAWACIRLLSESVGSLPLFLYERTPDGRRKAENHRLFRVLHSQPNSESAAGTLWESSVASMLLRGNAYCEILRFNNKAAGLVFLNPRNVQFRKQPNGEFQLIYTELDGKQRVVPRGNIFHVPGFSLDGRYGVSAIQYGAGVFGNALAAQNAANNTWDKGLMPTTAFTLEQVIKTEQRDDFKTYVDNVAGALNAGESVVLEGGMDAKQIGINPRDAQLLESRTFSVEEVCRWFRVDPSLVGHGGKDSNFGTGLEQKMLGFLMFSLRIWLTRIEQAINRQLLTPAEQTQYYAEYSIEGLLRADSKARAEFYQIMVTNGILTRDEVRRLENLPPMGGNADVLTVNAATVNIDEMAVGNQGATQNDSLSALMRNYSEGAQSEKLN